MDNQANKLANYGKIRGNSKGGFSVSDRNDTMKVTRRRDTEPVWDERSTKAIELIKEFLGDAIKKRDLDMYEILMGFLERNEKGDLEYARVMDLYKHEAKFDDERWKEGLRLIKESFSNHLKGFGYEFKFRNDEGKSVNMSIAIIPITDHELYQVNNKEVYKDSNGNWITRQEFTQQERNAFNNYKKA
eukprot:gene918-1293_t